MSFKFPNNVEFCFVEVSTPRVAFEVYKVSRFNWINKCLKFRSFEASNCTLFWDHRPILFCLGLRAIGGVLCAACTHKWNLLLGCSAVTMLILIPSRQDAFACRRRLRCYARQLLARIGFVTNATRKIGQFVSYMGYNILRKFSHLYSTNPYWR